MKLEIISVNLMQKTLNHVSSSDATKLEMNKKTMMADAIKYIEDLCNKGYEIISAVVNGSSYIYHLIKK